MRWIFVMLAPLTVALVYSLFSLFKYTRMISNIFLSLVYSPQLEPPAPAMNGERITILDSGGEEIEAFFVRALELHGVAIFCHESGATKESWEKYAYFLPALGWGVLSVDFGSQAAQPDKNSLSQWPTETEMRKLVTVIRWAKKAYDPKDGVVLFGVSNGADIALAASFCDPVVRAVVADGLFSMKEIFRDYIRKWAPILVKPNFLGEHVPEWIVNLFASLGFWYSQRKCSKRFIDVERLLARRHVPIFLVYGAEDDYVSPAHRRFLVKIDRSREAGGGLVVPNARHNQAVLVGREVYQRDITAFLRNRVETR